MCTCLCGKYGNYVTKLTFGFIQDTNSFLAEGLALFLTVTGQIDAFVVETHVLMSLFSFRHQTFFFFCHFI